MKIYNTLGRKKQEFRSLHDRQVNMYSCGPTVYDYAHIGNLRAFIFTDLLKRYLKYKGYNVTHVMNITDVDDKTIRNSRAQHKTLKEFTEFYTKEFLKDLETLGIQKPDFMPKATESIKEMIRLIEALKKNGYTYESKGTVYFKIAQFKDYGKLACLDLSQLKQNADGRLDSDNYDKEDARDFALWKAYNKEEDGDVFWETPFGKGRPGWHIECSAMSTAQFGPTFDIHTGGVDLVFPHHTNEIAQSEAATGKPFVKYWIHCAHLIVNGEKMSKSLGNFFTLRDLMKKGYSAKAIRYQLLSTHYRQQLNFLESALKQIPDTLNKFSEFMSKLTDMDSEKDNSKIPKLIENAKKGFEKSMDDDLNISGGLAAIFDFMNEVNKLMSDYSLSKKDAGLVRETMLNFDSVLGILEEEKEDIPKEVMQLVQKRETARKEKDWKASDDIRNQIQQLGYSVNDTPKGPRVKKL